MVSQEGRPLRPFLLFVLLFEPVASTPTASYSTTPRGTDALIPLLGFCTSSTRRNEAELNLTNNNDVGERLFAVEASFCRPTSRLGTTKFPLITPATGCADSHTLQIHHVWRRRGQPSRSLPLAHARRIAYTTGSGKFPGTRIFPFAIAAVEGPGRLRR